MNNFIIYINVISLVTFGVAVEEPYVGEGVLGQIPPSPYYGGVIHLRDYNTRRVYSESFSIRAYDGWKTTFTFEELQIADTSDKIEIKSQESEEESPVTINEITGQSNGGNFTITASSTHLVVHVFFWLFTTEPRNVRIRWISTPPSTIIQGGYITKGSEIKYDGFPAVDSVLLNLVSDGGVSWQVDTGDRVVDIESGPQMLTNISRDVLYVQPVNSSTNHTKFLLEWFPYVPDNHIQDRTSGCLSYINQDPVESAQNWLLKVNDSQTFNGSSLEISFLNVTTFSDNFTLSVLIDGVLFMKSTTSMSRQAVYYIPVSADSEVMLTLTTSDPFTLILCYNEHTRTDFYASGYIRSENYPMVLGIGRAHHVQGFPLPANWSLNLILEKLDIEYLRAWLDLVMRNGDSQTRFLQSYTGYGKGFYEQLAYDRYPITEHVWHGFYADIGAFGGRIFENEVIAQFESTTGLVRRPQWQGFSIKWNARLQTEGEGDDYYFISGDSGTVTSPNYPRPYHASSDSRLLFDIAIANTTAYNALEFSFGDSYTEPDVDNIGLWEHRTPGVITPITVPPEMRSGNMTGYVFTYITTRIAISFNTDVSKEYKGFSVDWRAIYVDMTNRSTLTSRWTVTSPSTADSTEESVTVQVIEDDEFDLSSGVLALVISMSVLMLILMIALVITLCMIIKYRKQLSDLKKDGFYRPKYNTAMTDIPKVDQ